MQLTQDCTKKFKELFKELARVHELCVKDLKGYLNSREGSERLLFSILAPEDMQLEMRTKLRNGAPCVYQLSRSRCSNDIAHEISREVHKHNHLQCLPHELISLIEDIVYEVINSDLDGFTRNIINKEECYNLQPSLLKSVATRRLKSFKKRFTEHVFQFPVTIFNLGDEILLISKNIQLLPLGSLTLNDKQLASFEMTRVFSCNDYLEVSISNRCSDLLARQLAEKARDAVFNILKLLATRLSPNAIPLLGSNENHRHYFDFHMHGKDRSQVYLSSVIDFASFKSDSKMFWKSFHEGRKEDKNIIDIAFKIPQLLLHPNFFKPQVVSVLERSLIWYGDAVSETNYCLQIQKLVSSLEALVNFNDGDVVKNFKDRVCFLNITHGGLDMEIKEKAGMLYKVRSNIVHGSSLEETLSFDVVAFCCETLSRAIFYFSLFGLEKTGFSKTLPAFIDDLPNLAICTPNTDSKLD